jgi:transcriptional regulator with XRE-family HTH domain
MRLRIDRLRALREQRGWSQRELGRISGLGDTQISRYEHGSTDPSSENLAILADHLNVSTDYLLGRTDNPRGTLGDGEISEDEQLMLKIYRSEGWVGIIKLVGERLTKPG